ncbi:EAL domain-containing protein [Bosea sp. TWI1241]|uniref:bifunctional diguanylate cyclase/phosphodiesterase n=1 Tax=Bosea sp. TWI1241 TaxID=3148904 RepID=UPI0032084EF5
MSMQQPAPAARTARRPLRRYLTALVLVALLPVIVSACVAVWRAGSAFRDASADQLLDTAQALSRAVEGEVNRMVTLLRVTARSAPAGNATPPLPIDGQISIEDRPRSGAVAEPAEGDLAGAAARADRPLVSNLFSHQPGGRVRVAIAVPHPQERDRARVAMLTIEPASLITSLQSRTQASPGLLFAVTDGAGQVIARSVDPERHIGQPVPEWAKLKALGTSSGTFRALTKEGEPIVFAFQEVRGTPGWVVVAGEHSAAFDARWQKPLLGLAVGAGLAILLALLVAGRIARLILAPVRALAAHAAAVAAGRASGPASAIPPSPIAEFEALRHSLDAAESALVGSAEVERRAAETLAASERRYRALAKLGALVFWRSTGDGAVTEAGGWSELTGKPEAAALGSGWTASVHPADRPMVTAVLAEARSHQLPLDIEFRIAGGDGQWRWVRARGTPMVDGGTITEWVGVFEDIDARRQAQARIAHMAHHDGLTGLPNRLSFRERLELAAAGTGRGPAEAVLCIDLDRFKEVNDTLGHPAGDALLRAVTERLCGQVRDGDVVARLGGDEFAIAQGAVPQPDGAAALAARLVEVLAQPFDLDGHQVVIGASIGIALIGPGDQPDTGLKNADIALYRAKEEGRGRFFFFEPAMDARMQARRAMELALRRGLAEEQFDLLYQPQVRTQTREITGFEALLRWRHPERGLLAPAEFIPLAEEIGLILPIGEWVLARACADAAKWPDRIKVAVNVAPSQLTQRGLPDAAARALKASGLEPSRLEIEITENALTADLEAVSATLFRLKSMGVRVTMDDFGTGYSSIGYLRSFPFDKIKIDASFVRSLGEEEESRAIIRAVTGLCDSLGIATTAEGVETAAQRDFLTAERCTEMQGFLFSEPQPASQVPQLLAAGTGQALPRPPLHIAK